jgi:hypothetical protein
MAVLSMNSLSLISKVVELPLILIAPPLNRPAPKRLPTLLSSNRVSAIVRELLKSTKMAPPTSSELFLRKVEFSMTAVVSVFRRMAPPLPSAELPEK